MSIIDEELKELAASALLNANVTGLAPAQETTK